MGLRPTKGMKIGLSLISERISSQGFVSGHGLSRAAELLKNLGFSPWVKQGQQGLKPVRVCTYAAQTRAYLLMVYSLDGNAPRTCYGATLFG